ncbi:MAG: AAA family ATPase, partial [Candidatus Limnocylindrales bacterium]
MADILIPDPSVIVLIGPAGSGKTTLAARHFAAAELLSSDALRARIAGDERDQRATGAAFRAIGVALERRLAADLLTVIDATNLRPADRRPWLAAARRHHVPAIAIVVDLPEGLVQSQNAGRDRVVDAEVVDRHLALLRRTIERADLEREGWDAVVRLRSATDVR